MCNVAYVMSNVAYLMCNVGYLTCNVAYQMCNSNRKKKCGIKYQRSIYYILDRETDKLIDIQTDR